MSSGKSLSLSVKDFFKQEKDLLRLHPVTGRKGFARRIVLTSPKKGSSSILILGQRRFDFYKSLPSERRPERLDSLFGGAVSCVILADGIAPPSEMRLKAEEKRLALFTSGSSTRACQKAVKDFLLQTPRNELFVPGGMLQMFGLGILIVGDSGIGKSESALELISRGHRFVSDDVTLFAHKKGDLYGSAPDYSRNFMEIRGLGIIDIKEIFGPESLCPRALLNLVIKLKRWEKGREYDRLGLEFPDSYEVLGKKASQIIIPVAPGRNIATLIEVACKVFLCRQKGYHAPQELIKKLDRALSRKPNARGTE